MKRENKYDIQEHQTKLMQNNTAKLKVIIRHQLDEQLCTVSPTLVTTSIKQ